MLTTQQLTSYRSNGYLLLRNWISDDEVDYLLEDVERLKREGITCYPEDLIMRDGLLNRIGSPIHHSPACLQTYGSPKVLGLVDSLYDGNFATFAESVVVKQPGDQGIAWHQDGHPSPEQTFDRGVNFGIYLHPSSEEDGCVHVVPGSHLRGPADIVKLQKPDEFLLEGAVPAEAERGDLLIHSRSVLHGADCNRSDHERITYYVGFHHRPAVESLFPEEEIDALMRVVSLAVRERSECGRYPNETPFSSPLMPEIGALSDDERESLTRGARHGI